MSIIGQLKEQQAEIQKQIEKIQDQCCHPEACTEVNEIGQHWDPLQTPPPRAFNCYCSLCEKRWVHKEEE